MQQLRGDGGLVRIIVVHDVHSGFSFRFSKTLFEGRLGRIGFSPSRGHFSPFVRWLENFFGHAEGSLLLTDIFPQILGTPFQKTFLAPDSPST